MKYKNIIFDLDGTLWDSRSTIIENWNQILLSGKYISKPLQESDLNQYMGLLADDILREIIPGISDDEISTILSEINETENESIRQHGGILYPNVANVLNKLSQSKNLFIVSNCQDGYIEAFLDYFQFSKLFQDFESYGRTRLVKSKNIELVLNRNNLDAKKTIYVGDTQTDLDAASKNQLDFIFCEYGFGAISNGNNFYQSISNFEKLLHFV